MTPVNHTTNWQPDPYGIHELRFFSADGKPTQLVMDAGMTSYDKPPQVEQPPDPGRQRSAAAAPVVDPVASPVSGSPRPPEPPAQLPAPSDQREPEPSRSVKPPTNPLDSSDRARGERPVQGHEDRSAQGQHEDRPGQEQPVQEQEVIGGVGMPRVAEVEHREDVPPLGRPLTIAYAIVLGLLALSALGLLYVHVLKPAKGGPAQTAAVTTSTVPARHATTTTAVALPVAPQSSADAAASALVSKWATGDRAAALTVATPAAVATLFAAPYTAGLAIDRGCSTSFTPIVCTFGPPGGASPNDPIYEILAVQAPGGWYVSSVKIEH